MWHYPHPIQALKHLLEASPKIPRPSSRSYVTRRDRRPGDSPRHDLLWKAVKVLLITDSLSDEQAFCKLVYDRALSWETGIAQSVSQARHCLGEDRFDIVIAPDHLAEGPCASLLAELGDTPFVLLTEALDERTARWTLERGADYLIRDRDGLYLEMLPDLIEKLLLRREIRERDAHLRRELRATFENAASGIARTDHQDRLVAVNERLCQMLSYSCEELLGKTVHELTYPPDRPRSESINQQLRQGRLSMVHYEKRYLKRDGTPLWVQVGISAVRNDAGKYQYSVCTIVDIHARKLAEQQVRLQAAALQAASTAVALCTADAQGVIVWVNEAFTRLTGYIPQEVVGRSHRFLRWGLLDQAFYHEVWTTCERGEPWYSELVNRKKDGTPYQEAMSITPIRDDSGQITHFLAIKEDITQRKQASEAQATAKQNAEQANVAKDHFLAVLSHELRTPLTPILTTASLLAHDNRLPADDREEADMIQRNAEALGRLVDDLLDVTRITRGKIELKREPVPLNVVLDRAVEVCRNELSAKNLHFEVELCPGEPCILLADSARLQQVFWNLLRNALKFTPAGGSVGIYCQRSDTAAIVEVRDSGDGIDPDVLPHIFNAYEQGGSNVTRQFGGLGLGLTIAKGVVENHGGSIEAFSEGKGTGTTFRVTLPLLKTEPAA